MIIKTTVIMTIGVHLHSLRSTKQILPSAVFAVQILYCPPTDWVAFNDFKNGNPNLDPYSQWQNLTFDQLMVMFAAKQRSSEKRKHTVVNA